MSELRLPYRVVGGAENGPTGALAHSLKGAATQAIRSARASHTWIPRTGHFGQDCAMHVRGVPTAWLLPERVVAVSPRDSTESAFRWALSRA
jgi:hypothetical protein